MFGIVDLQNIGPESYFSYVDLRTYRYTAILKYVSVDIRSGRDLRQYSWRSVITYTVNY